MELVIFVGIPAVGKSTFFRERFADTHVRINLDMLRTRHRERLLVAACLKANQPFVVDNTNLSARERAVYIEPARRAGFRVVGFYFRSVLSEARDRNAARMGDARIPDKGVLGAASRLETPAEGEGFDRLSYVRIADGGGFVVEPWRTS